MIALSWAVALPASVLMPFDFWWQTATRRMRWSVPGSLRHAYYKERCRKLRYPGFMFWPFIVVNNTIGLIQHRDSGWVWVWVTLVLGMGSGGVLAWREFCRQVREDDDDPWNKLKRGVRSRLRQLRGIRVRIPLPAAGV